MPRLFTALWPDAEALDALAAWQCAYDWPPVARPTPRENLHVTLHFLGEVPEERVAAVTNALETPGAGDATLVLSRPTMWHGGVLVLQPEADAPDAIPAALRDRHDRLGRALEAAGQPVDTRPWRPHATLCRHAAGAASKDAPPPPPVRLTARGHALVVSTGGRYTVLRRYD